MTGSLPTTSYAYDGAGDTTTLGSQTLTWNPNGKIATAGTAAAPSSYIYTADGDELVEADTSGGTTTTTLYLPNEQLSTNGTSTTGVRYYTFAGHLIGETTPTTLYWLSGNTQGTMTTAVAAFSESTVIRRATTPYGTVLTGVGTWPDNKGFLGDPAHSATGLVDVGARKFDPAIDLFISVDPVLSTSSPQTMTGYTYAADDPISNSDPSGEMYITGSGCIGSLQYCEAHTPRSSAPPRPPTAGDYLGGGNYGMVSVLLGIPRALLFPVPPKPKLYPEMTGGAPCARFGANCGVQMVPLYHNNNDGVGMALSWLTGIGNRHQYFNQWDPMTQQLMRDPHIQGVTSLIARKFLPEGLYSNSNPYKDHANPASYFFDMWDYWTGAHLGGRAPVDGFLGSYQLTWAAVPTSSDSARVFFTATNVTDNNSGLFHANSLVGNMDGWTLGHAGPLSAVTQTYQWQVTIGY